MLSLLLARAGVEVTVLEKHADFLRDFRGDTLHPSTLEVMREIGLLERLLALPHQKVETVSMEFGGRRLQLGDFRRLNATCRYIALMPQWDFLNLIATEAANWPGFRLMMRTEATGLIEQGGRVAGVTAQGPDGPLEIRAGLVVAADGRSSVLRAQAGLRVEDYGAPMDVQWFSLPRDPALDVPLATFGPGAILILLPRGDYWQCGHVVPKGGDAALRGTGFPAFRARLAAIRPELTGALDALEGWSDVKLLTVEVNRLTEWCREGLLCIGDAAHAMSPSAASASTSRSRTRWRRRTCLPDRCARALRT